MDSSSYFEFAAVPAIRFASAVAVVVPSPPCSRNMASMEMREAGMALQFGPNPKSVHILIPVATKFAKVKKAHATVASPQVGSHGYDVGSLFSRFHGSPSLHYQELKRHQTAQAVVERWPLLSELQRDDVPPGDR